MTARFLFLRRAICQDMLKPFSFPFILVRCLVLVLALVILSGVPAGVAFGKEMPATLQKHENAKESSKPEQTEQKEEKESLPQAAPHLKTFGPYQVFGTSVGPLIINSSMVVTWIVALFLILFAQIATRNVQLIPSGAQNFWEWLVESLHDFLEGIIGPVLVKRTFWFFATVFIFILFTNWFGLIPGVGTIGWGVPDASGGLHHIALPLFRGGNADLNMTFAMAMIFFVCWIVWAIQANGPLGFVAHLFSPPKGDMTGALKFFISIIFVMIGVLEIVSILFRPVSLSLRLFGNIFAGENMLEAMSDLVHGLSWLLPIPFYFMELLVGLVQAMVFMLLTAVFTLLICQHDEEEHGSHH